MRINVYVDGFNLYYRALRDPRAPDGSTYKWLNLEALAATLLPPPRYAINRIRYFTAKVKALPGDPQAPTRQQMYLRALATLPLVSVHFGYFMSSKVKMRLVSPLTDASGQLHERVRVHKQEEKGSDVNIASYLLLDGFRNDYDAAAVITNDSDLVIPIKFVKDELGKDIEVLDPCGTARTSAELKQVCTFYKPIRTGAIAASQFAPQLTDAKGAFHKPATW